MVTANVPELETVTFRGACGVVLSINNADLKLQTERRIRNLITVSMIIPNLIIFSQETDYCCIESYLAMMVATSFFTTHSYTP